MQRNKRKIIEVEEKDPKEEAVRKMEFLICKSLKGNMATKNIVKLFEIQQTIDERHGNR